MKNTRNNENEKYRQSFQSQMPSILKPMTWHYAMTQRAGNGMHANRFTDIRRVRATMTTGTWMQMDQVQQKPIAEVTCWPHQGEGTLRSQ